jgi:hypothetical protein
VQLKILQRSLTVTCSIASQQNKGHDVQSSGIVSCSKPTHCTPVVRSIVYFLTHRHVSKGTECYSASHVARATLNIAPTTT